MKVPSFLLGQHGTPQRPAEVLKHFKPLEQITTPNCNMENGCGRRGRDTPFDQIKVCNENLPVSGNVVYGAGFHFICALAVGLAGAVLLD